MSTTLLSDSPGNDDTVLWLLRAVHPVSDLTINTKNWQPPTWKWPPGDGQWPPISYVKDASFWKSPEHDSRRSHLRVPPIVARAVEAVQGESDENLCQSSYGDAPNERYCYYMPVHIKTVPSAIRSIADVDAVVIHPTWDSSRMFCRKLVFGIYPNDFLFLCVPYPVL